LASQFAPASTAWTSPMLQSTSETHSPLEQSRRSSESAALSSDTAITSQQLASPNTRHRWCPTKCTCVEEHNIGLSNGGQGASHPFAHSSTSIWDLMASKNNGKPIQWKTSDQS